MSSMNLKMEDVAGTDPFVRFLIARGRKPWQLAALVFGGGLLFLSLVSLAFGVFFPREGLRSSLADYFNQVNYLVVFPAAGFYYLWQVSGMLKMYAAVLNLHPAEKQAGVVAIIRKAQGQRRLWRVSLLIGLVVVGLGIADNLSKVGAFWYAENVFTIALMQMARLFAVYVIITAILRHLAMANCLNELFEELNLPVSIAQTPYTVAFDAITAQALSFAALGAIAGLNIGLQPVLSDVAMPEYVIFVSLYFVLVPAGFFLPFLQARSKMIAAKKRVLAELGHKLQDEYERLLHYQSGDPDPDRAEAALGRVKTLQETIAITDQAPSWPFGLVSIYRLGATVILPFVFAIFNLILEVQSFLGK